jgi:hypothetical protein
MARLRDVVDKLEVRRSKRANRCKFNSSHKVSKGHLWLIVTRRGPTPRDFSYCTQCGIAMLEDAQERLAHHLAALRDDESS